MISLHISFFKDSILLKSESDSILHFQIHLNPLQSYSRIQVISFLPKTKTPKINAIILKDVYLKKEIKKSDDQIFSKNVFFTTWNSC